VKDKVSQSGSVMKDDGIATDAFVLVMEDTRLYRNTDFPVYFPFTAASRTSARRWKNVWNGANSAHADDGEVTVSIQRISRRSIEE
jgi:hypothetical protein